MKGSEYEMRIALRSPRIVSRKFPVLAHTGTIIAVLKMIDVVCSHDGRGLKM